MTQAAIQTRALSKGFPGGVKAVRNLDLSIPRGAVFGLLGRNGAGKTTLIRLLMGLLHPDGGTSTLLGKSMWLADRVHRQQVTYVSQDLRLHARMTLSQLCHFLSHFYDDWDGDRVQTLAQLFELPLDRQVGVLSGGEQRKAALLLALAPRPKLLLLDEPAAGLDPVSRRQHIDALVEALNGPEELTVLLSTHIVSDLERIADHVGFMDHGKIETAGPLETFQTEIKRVQIIFDAPKVPAGFALPGAISQQCDGPVYSAVAPIENGAAAELQAAHQARVQIFDLGLEELFMAFHASKASQEEPHHVD